jgi:predicted dehydrogenase
MISFVYLRNLTSFPDIQVKACADKIPERATERAKDFGVEKACTVEEILEDPSVELIVNLTLPKAHAEVTLKSIEAGKAVYSEKPLATSREEGKTMVQAAESKGVKVGCAPDTFLGAGLQTSRKLLDDGKVGTPVAAVAFRADHGPDEHLNDASFFYQRGGGPLFDMGPYYLTWLVNLLGPIKRVTASTKISFPQRTALSKPPWGSKVKVEEPTHVTASLDFHSGIICSLMTSFDVWASSLPHIEVYGSSGTLQVPNPNRFGGKIKMRQEQGDWVDIPPLSGYLNDNDWQSDFRRIGVLDMAYAIRSGREHRANLELAYHVLDVTQALYEPSASQRHIYVESTCKRPAPLPLDATEDEIHP